MSTNGLGNLIREARRRRVFRLAGLYIVGAWVLVQIALAVFPAFDIPETAIRYVWLGAVLGFPIALIFGWRYDFTGGRIVRTVATDDGADLSIGKIDIAILGALSVVAVILVSGLLGEVSDTRAPAVADSLLPDVDPNSIAVMPFVNMSEDPENEFFADGLSEELLNLLAKIPELQVTSRSSAFSLKGQNLDIPTIATRLNVAHVLEGSVRVDGDQVRITAQLIEAETDRHLWSDTFDRKFESIFDVQDEVAAAVTDALHITLQANLDGAIGTDPEAYALYLRAQQWGDDREALLRQALAIDPDYAPGWTSLGWHYFFLPENFTGAHGYEESADLARIAVQRAIELDPGYAPAWVLQSRIHYTYDWDFEVAHAAIRNALDLDPGNADILETAMRLELTLGNVDRAVDIAREQLAIDPLYSHVSLGRALFHAGRYDEAARHLRMHLSLNPTSTFTYLWLAQVDLAQGNPQAARSNVEQMPEDEWRDFSIIPVLYALGETQEADAAFNSWANLFGDSAPYQVAGLCGARGDADCVFEWLQKAFESRESGLTQLKTDWMMTEFHDDPRWGELLDRIGLPR